MLKIVRRNKIAIDKLLFQAKTAIIKEGKKMALEYAYSLIPTEDQVISKMEELSKRNPKEAKKYYDETKNLLEGVKNKLTSSTVKLDTIKTKLESVDSKITYISSIAGIIEPFITTLQSLELGAEAIVTTAGATPTAPPGPIASSAVFKEKIKGTLQKAGSSILLATRTVFIVKKTYIKLKRKVDEAHTKISQLISFIDNLLAKLEQLFIDILLPLLEDPDNLPVIQTLEDLYSHYPGMEGYLNSDDANLPPLDFEEDKLNTTNGVSNLPPKFFRRYRNNPYVIINGQRSNILENPNNEE